MSSVEGLKSTCCSFARRRCRLFEVDEAKIAKLFSWFVTRSQTTAKTVQFGDCFCIQICLYVCVCLLIGGTHSNLASILRVCMCAGGVLGKFQVERIAVANRETARVYVKRDVDRGTLSGRGDTGDAGMMDTNRPDVSWQSTGENRRFRTAQQYPRLLRKLFRHFLFGPGLFLLVVRRDFHAVFVSLSCRCRVVIDVCRHVFEFDHLTRLQVADDFCVQRPLFHVSVDFFLG